LPEYQAFPTAVLPVALFVRWRREFNDKGAEDLYRQTPIATATIDP
jgi:hypothetical protein